MFNAAGVALMIICPLLSAGLSLPICQDTIPFSIKLAGSSFVVYGDLEEISALPLSKNQSKSFNITLLVRCVFKGQTPAEQRITIEHSPPENPLCYRTLVSGHTYVFFLNEAKTAGVYQQKPFHELSLIDDATVEILKRTCGLQPRPFHPIVPSITAQVDIQCPIVSVGCS